MLVQDNKIQEYLLAYHNGEIKEGLKIGCELDKYLKFKQGSFNMILGHDNVGKTYWRMWYYLVLSTKYNFKWCIWTGENQAGQIVRNLIQLYSGKYVKNLSLSEIHRYKDEVCQWFNFVDNSKTYKYKELLDIFGDDDYNGCLIDPYTGLDRKYGHSDNYEFLNTTRQWVNQKKVSIDVCTHPVSSSGRAGGVYPKGHDWEGHIRNPFKADVEGGKPFGNRCDDFIVLHRLNSHPQMKTYTLVYVDKVKDVESGGGVTDFDVPLFCEFNNGLGFKIEGVNPLTDKPVEVKDNYTQKPLKPLGEDSWQTKDDDEIIVPF